MLHLQTVFPSLKSNASFTANLRTDEDMLMDVKTIISLPETHYQQKVSFKYGYLQSLSTHLTQDKDRLRTCVLFLYIGSYFCDFLQILTNWKCS